MASKAQTWHSPDLVQTPLGSLQELVWGPGCAGAAHGEPFCWETCSGHCNKLKKRKKSYIQIAAELLWARRGEVSVAGSQAGTCFPASPSGPAVGKFRPHSPAGVKRFLAVGLSLDAEELWQGSCSLLRETWGAAPLPGAWESALPWARSGRDVGRPHCLPNSPLGSASSRSNSPQPREQPPQAAAALQPCKIITSP